MTIKERVYKLLSENTGVEIEAIEDSCMLAEDLNIAPEEVEGVLEIIAEDFEVEFSRTQIEKLVTVDDLVELVRDILNEYEE